MKIITRFSPSPTGYLHIGNVRTALYSWLFARSQNGKFILRIEDTDEKRSTQKSIDNIITEMSWLNLDWDSGPYFQTQRFDRYNSIIENMLIKGSAYKCYCSKERLKALRDDQIKNYKKPRYDGYCRNYHHTSNKVDKSFVVRFRNPKEGSVIFNDQIRGPIEFNNQELDDFVIRRSDGRPTYNFCVVIDDLDMKITHVVRGEDHINNTPRQINIFKVLGAPTPKYAHVSMILNKDGNKLSKRHETESISKYRKDGFLPEAILNYLVRMGWSCGNQEIFSIDEMKKLFNLDAISKSSSTLNMKKLIWLNHYYLNHLSINYIATHLAWHVEQQGIDIQSGPKLEEIVKLFRKRCKNLKDMASSCQYFYRDFDKFEYYSAKKYFQPEMIEPLQEIRTKLSSIIKWNIESLHDIIYKTARKFSLEISKISMPLRVAVTGICHSPDIYATIYAIGQKRAIERIDTALKFISALSK